MTLRLCAASLFALTIATAGAAAIAEDNPAAIETQVEQATPAPDGTAPAPLATPDDPSAAPADPSAAPVEPAAPPAADAPVPISERPIDEIFRLRCRTCHTDDGTGSAPTLKGIYNRKLAAIEGYNYTAAMKAKGGVWDDAALDAYLERPSAYIPGTKMFTTSRDPEQRAKLIEYMKTY